MRDAKLFSGAIFLFLIFLTVGFFQLLKPQPKATIQHTKNVELRAFQQDVLPDNKSDEVKIVSNSLHVSNSIEFNRHAVYLCEILFYCEPEITSYSIRPVAPYCKLFSVLARTLISPNAP